MNGNWTFGHAIKNSDGTWGFTPDRQDYVVSLKPRHIKVYGESKKHRDSIEDFAEDISSRVWADQRKYRAEINQMVKEFEKQFPGQENRKRLEQELKKRNVSEFLDPVRPVGKAQSRVPKGAVGAARRNYNLDKELEKIKAAGVRGTEYIWIKEKGKKDNSLIINKYGKKWWKKATKQDILRVVIR